MPDYQKLYFMLFNNISESIVQLQKYSASLIKTHIELVKIEELEQCISHLKQAQIQTEQIIIEGEE